MAASERRRSTASVARKPRRNAAENSPRRQELLQIAQEVITEKGFSRTSVRDIAQRADMLSGSLFYHFPTKDALAEALFKPVFERVVEITREVAVSDVPVEERIAELTRQTIVLCGGEYRPAWVMLLDDWQYFIKTFASVQAAFDEITQWWLQLVKQGITAGTVRDDVDPPVLMHIMRGVMNDMVRRFDPDGAYSIEQVADAVVAVILTGVLGQNAAPSPAAVGDSALANGSGRSPRYPTTALSAVVPKRARDRVLAGLRNRRGRSPN